jgi:methionyl-tRNA formyltransferase
MRNSKKLVFFGNERLATSVTTTAPSLRALINAGYEIKAVVVSHQEAVSRKKRSLEIAQLAKAYKIPLILAKKEELADQIREFKAEFGVLVAFGQMISKKVINLFPKGIINIHPSLLPKMRGPTPIETAILEGAKETGVSLMQLTAKMDAGPIFTQQVVNLKSHETKQELADRLSNIGANLLIKNLPAILDGQIIPTPQDEKKATYTKLLKKEDGILDFGQPAEVLERQVRAYAGWPKSRAKIYGHEVIVIKARVTKNQTDGRLVVQCQPGYLEILELIGPSGHLMSGADFLRGYS